MYFKDYFVENETMGKMAQDFRLSGKLLKSNSILLFDYVIFELIFF